MVSSERGYVDFPEHLARLEVAGMVRRIEVQVNKDTELHPLVRWQYRGGIPDEERKAFIFSHVTDATGRGYDMPVVVGALAGSRAIYRAGLGVDTGGVGPLWRRAIEQPLTPVEVTDAPCQEVVIDGDDLMGSGKGLDALPVPISTPGYDSAPYITAGNFVTRDPDTGLQNLGTYRGGLKASNRIGVRMSTRSGGAGGYFHWLKYQAQGEKMPCAIIVGCPPVVAYTGPQKLPQNIEELAVAGGLAGEPIRVTRCHSIDALVPADSEIVIEGLIDTEYLEPEAPFGESHGHIALEDFNMIFDVTAITRKKDALFASIISQVTPSESSAIKRDAYEQMFLDHLRNSLGIRGVKNVIMHEPLTNIRRVIFLVIAPETSKSEIWRALYGATSLRADCGKYVMAVSEDIEPDNGDGVFWSLAYRANPAEDVVILRNRDGGHGPKGGVRSTEGTMLVDATLKHTSAPLALPKRSYMEHARNMWENLQLPPLNPETPWYGYSLGDWTEEWDTLAVRATEGGYFENGERSKQRRVRANGSEGLKPNTSVRDVPA
ncbi:MAG: UbiD family decarboxylase [Pseudomonadota bacterium]|nr:UbiD family decarboxylase [Pseudomonadota bacterium]